MGNYHLNSHSPTLPLPHRALFVSLIPQSTGKEFAPKQCLQTDYPPIKCFIFIHHRSCIACVGHAIDIWTNSYRILT